MLVRLIVIVSLAFVCTFSALSASAVQESTPKPIRALLITGGCCHDYTRQKDAIAKGIMARANVRVDVYWTDNSTTAPIFPLYAKLDWAENYDVIIHDECAAAIKDQALVNRIIQVHQKIPAVHLHCAMHSFRTGTDAWFKHLGLKSTSHGPQKPIEISFVDAEHPITKPLSDWTTIDEELYNNVKVFGAHALAKGKQRIDGKNPRVAEAIVAWTNETEGARSFSTTIGHNTETVEDPRYLDLVTRGLLWSCDKLSPEYLHAYTGEHKTVFIDKNEFKATDSALLGTVPEGATLVKVTASTTQNGHPPFQAIDGKLDTRWCAIDARFPQWLQLEFEKPLPIRQFSIDWEKRGAAYRYRIDGSIDGKTWLTLVDRSKNTSRNQAPDLLNDAAEIRFIRLHGIGSEKGWCSLWEFQVEGDGITKIWPADPKVKDKFVPLQAYLYEKRGNIQPRIEMLSPDQESAILQDVTVPDGFEATLFAAPPAVNYPVFVAAAVDGTLFVSSDGNGSLGRDPQRGRVIRLRDLDGDGRADETKVFCEVDAPRGLVWDKDRLYLMHPPHLSVFIDKNGDGVADEQRTLVKNLAFGYDQRPADHTTNGVSLGVDGWLYIAGGDFGFINAEGTDGRRVTHRGGGVIRVRPDGTGLEVYSTGTRNILEVAISPTMDMFARDNTNDGGGWDVRLHHFTGMDDHGYPRLFKNFSDECVQPLADYGGGSGCGAVYIDEPGFGKWNNGPFTADWGTGSIYRHSVEPFGATYRESAPPQPFVKMTRPTDADVDGMSRVYCASWKGATFKWAGPNVGYIVCVRPKDFHPEPLPDFAKATEDDLIAVLDSPSHRRRMEAQRELLRRGSSAGDALLTRVFNARTDARNLVEHLQTNATIAEQIEALASSDPLVVHTAIRCLASQESFPECFDALDAGHSNQQALLRALAMIHKPAVVDGLINRLTTSTSERRQAILIALCRLHFREGKWKGDSWGTRPDTRGPYYQPEAWSETERIYKVLQHAIETASDENAAILVTIMDKNRIRSNAALNRMVRLAQNDDALLGTTASQLARVEELPEGALDLLLNTAARTDLQDAVLLDTIAALVGRREPEVGSALLAALSTLNMSTPDSPQLNRAQKLFVNARALPEHVSTFIHSANAETGPQQMWSYIALLTVASRNDVSPETLETARQAIDRAWLIPDRQETLMLAAEAINNHYLDDRIIELSSGNDLEVAAVAKRIMQKLKIDSAPESSSPRIDSMPMEEAVATIVKTKGDVELGKQVFKNANCGNCHTVQQDEVQKGPYLGNIAKTYKRPDLTTAILEPSKSIAQGFTTNTIVTLDGLVLTGFVTEELSDRVSIRDQEGKAHTIHKADIDQRQTSPISVMPKGVMDEFTVQDMASLLDYLESLPSQ